VESHEEGEEGIVDTFEDDEEDDDDKGDRK
jgi:hypothetical protein